MNPVSREMSRGDGEKKRVETFRNIRYGDGRIYIIGERERANLVVQLARFFYTRAMQVIVGRA